MKEKTVLLYGTVGSTAYGLATPSSDVDKLGVFAESTSALLGLNPPAPTQVMTEPDITLHEALKYCKLALHANPTVMELLWLPNELYDVRTEYGDRLIALREAFLSATYVRNAYFGFASQQFKKLTARGDGTFGPDLKKRTAKHARHMYRLLQQGFELWSTGALTVEVSDPEDVRAFGQRIENGDLTYARTVLRHYETKFDMVDTVLPKAADEKIVEEWLLSVRGVA